MQAGAATIDITPATGVELSGGAFGPAKGVQHPLTANALYIQNGPERVLLVSCDLLGFPVDLADRIRKAISRATDVAYDGILLSATHTHGGPAVVPLRGWGQPDDEYIAALGDKLVTVSAEAASALEDVTVTVGATRCEGVGVNRCLGDDAGVNDRLTALRFDRSDGTTLATIVNFAAHPVNLHSNGRITPDFPHYVREAIARELNAEAPLLYFTGACGDVNPANFQQGEPSDDAAKTTGETIAAAALDALADGESAGDELAFCALDITLPLQALPSREELNAVITEREPKMQAEDPSPTNWAYCGHRAAVEWARDALQALDAGSAASAVKTTLSAVRIGSAAIVGIPGELFSEYGRSIAEAETFEYSFAATLTNGCMGYFPSPEAYEKETYEAVACPRFIGLQLFGEDVGQRVEQGARTVLKQLTHMDHCTQSRRLWGQSCNVIVGGGQAHKRPVKYLYRGGAAFAQRAQGARFWDADGNEYIDYLLSYGPIVIGHCDPDINAAVRKCMDESGTVFSVEHPLAIELAETLTETIPSAEMVMYFLGGSSATLGAIRTARAYTGRETMLRCGYHGWYDAFAPIPKGIALEARSHMLTVPYNDLDALRKQLEANPGQVAGVIIESIQDDGPTDGYYDGVRALCDEHGAVFILDEVKTGFRFALGGAQERFGIDPDLSCFGKAMCNGYPGSVVVGKRRFMEGREDTFMAATFHSDLLSIAAARETIRILRERDGIAHFDRLGQRLIDGLNDVLLEEGLPMRVGGFAAMPAPAETSVDDASNPCPPEWKGQVMGAWFGAMQRRGIYMTGHPWYLSLAHTAEDIEQTIEIGQVAAAEAVAELKELTRTPSPRTTA
ncbi:MAG: aminotransferase class III-fold pyridoxal phosphate-dependent enzyme [Phycisphaerae bacterium]